jgi:hypothetical protein
MFKNDYPYEDVPYWTPWRIICGLYLIGCASFVLLLILMFLFEVDPETLPPVHNWQIFLISLTPVMVLVAIFSLVPYGDG